jgi:hypothetical protein
VEKPCGLLQLPPQPRQLPMGRKLLLLQPLLWPLTQATLLQVGQHQSPT